jgi:hypothetical protein
MIQSLDDVEYSPLSHSTAREYLARQGYKQEQKETTVEVLRKPGLLR